MKKFTLTLAAIVFGFGLFTASAHAGSFDGYENFYPVDSNGSTTAKYAFDINDPAPWVYLKLSEKFNPQTDVTLSSANWISPSGNLLYAPNPAFYSNSLEQWIQLPDWNSFKETGLWYLNAVSIYSNPFKGVNTGFSAFVVTPEPISSSLFLIGGGALAAFRIRRKIKK